MVVKYISSIKSFYMTVDDGITFIFSSPLRSAPSSPQMIWEEQIFETQFVEIANWIVLAMQQ